MPRECEVPTCLQEMARSRHIAELLGQVVDKDVWNAALKSAVTACATVAEGTILSIHKRLLLKKLAATEATSRACALSEKLVAQSKELGCKMESHLHPLLQRELYVLMTSG